MRLARRQRMSRIDLRLSRKSVLREERAERHGANADATIAEEVTAGG
jgi:hypothetical protein